MRRVSHAVESKDIDRGYAWVILTACFFLYMLSLGVVKTFGILYEELIDQYGFSAGATAFIVSVAHLIFLGGGPLWNSLCVRLSYRAMFVAGGVCLGTGFVCSAYASRLEFIIITLSLIGGVGIGLLNCCNSYVNFYFERRRALANGIVVSAAGVSSIIYPYLYRVLIENYGLTGALLIIGGILLNTCVAGMLCRYPQQLTIQNKNKKFSFIAVFTFRWNLFKNKSYCILNIAFAVTVLGYISCIYMLPVHIVRKGYTKYDAAFALLVHGIAESSSRIAMGWFTDLKFVSPSFIYAGSMAIGGVSAICFPLTSHLPVMYACAVIFGMFPGLLFTLIPVILVEKLGVETLPASFGLVTMSMAVLFVVGQPALGYLSDYTGSWYASYMCAGTLLMLAALLVLMEALCCKMSNDQNNEESDDV